MNNRCFLNSVKFMNGDKGVFSSPEISPEISLLWRDPMMANDSRWIAESSSHVGDIGI